MPPIVTYTLLASFAGLFAVGFYLAGDKGAKRFPRLQKLAVVLQIAVVAGAYFVLRPGRGVDGRAAIATSASAGKPILLDLYSNF
jgi:hypothetical protein